MIQKAGSVSIVNREKCQPMRDHITYLVLADIPPRDPNHGEKTGPKRARNSMEWLAKIFIGLSLSE